MQRERICHIRLTFDGMSTIISLDERSGEMVKAGEIYTSEIIDTTVLGMGFTTVNGFAVFVRGAVEGDVCSYEITEVRQNYAAAECCETVEMSRYRCDSDCPAFPECGGCVHRGITLPYENKIKASAVNAALRKVGIGDVPVREILTPDCGGERYRNKAIYHFDSGRNCGFYSHRTCRVIPISSECCRCVPKIFSDIAYESALYMKSHSELEPEELMLRISTGGDVVAALTLRRGECTGYSEHIRSRFPAVTGVVARIGKGDYKTVSGDGYINSELLGISFGISPEAFFQVNYAGAELLLGIVISACAEYGVKHGTDLYCGTGVIGIALAHAMLKSDFVGVEQNSSAVSDAIRNAQRCGLDNISFRCGDAAKLIPRGDFDLAVVDPPRRGLSRRALGELVTLAPERIVYISCNPQTLARDLAGLTDAGYNPLWIQPINMFPRTEHVECVTLLLRNAE